MVLNHIAAIFFFSGPLFYIGLVMVVDPAGIAVLPELFGHALRKLRRALGGHSAQKMVLNWNKLVLPTDYEEP
jgi:hypothetical protein